MAQKKTPSKKTPETQKTATTDRLIRILLRFERFAWDAAGVFLIALALMTLVALLIPTLAQGALLMGWTAFLRRWFGWGSLVFVAARFGTRLVVVLGHSQCGAILATIEELQQPTQSQSPNLRSIVDRVRPSVEVLLRSELRHDLDTLVQHAVRANVDVSVNHLRHGSAILEQAIQNEGLLVVGAEYSLETGEVEFFDCD